MLIQPFHGRVGESDIVAEVVKLESAIEVCNFR